MSTDEIRALLQNRFEEYVDQIGDAIEAEVTQSLNRHTVDTAVNSARHARQLLREFDGALLAAQAQAEREADEREIGEPRELLT